MKQELKFNGVIDALEDNGVPLYNQINKRINDNKKLKLSKYSSGPPDLIYFVREPVKQYSYFGFKSKSHQKLKQPNLSKKFGTYHYIYGIDTSNMMSVANYINDYIDKQKKFFKKYNNNNFLIENNNNQKYNQLKNSTIIQAVFCSYDIFIEKDFRIIFKYPGGFDKFYFYNGHQNDYDVTEDELRTIFLSSILRSWNYIGDNSYLNNSIFLEEIKNNSNFNSLIDSIIYILVERLEFKYPNLERKIGLLLHWFLKYLMHTRRYSFILTYFSKMSYVDTNLSQYALKPLYYINGYSDGLQFISTLLTSNTNPLLICFEIEFLTILEKYEHAIKVGKYLTTMNPGFNEAWIKLAQLYLKLKQYNKCLKALNNLNYLKVFLGIDNINYDNPFSIYNEYNQIYVKEIPLANTDIDNNMNKNNYNINVSSIIKYNDLLYCSKYHVDFFYNSTYLLFSEKDDLIKDIVNKITKSKFLKFNKEQKKMYYILLQIIKEINFTKFLEIKNNQFSSTKKNTNNKNNNIIINDKINNNNEQIYENQSNSNISTKDNKNSESTNNNDNNNISENDLLKILINPFFEIVIDTLIEDIKLFSLGCIQKEKSNINIKNKKMQNINNNNTDTSSVKNICSFGQILNKKDLPKSEIKFCIVFGILCERLKYYKIALRYYLKALNYCYSKFVYSRVIKILLKIKDYKNCILKLNNFLLYFNPKEFHYAYKTPLWIDKIILEVLYEYQANDILSWIKQNSSKEIINFIKQIVNKYKEWVENGHEFHLLK
jgi:hypothetical protein